MRPIITADNSQINKVQVRLRAAVVSMVYEKALKARPPASSKSSENEEDGSTGAVLNLMSTDCDRVANFCGRFAPCLFLEMITRDSFHQFWSLPFQIAVCLYLLYRQVGLAFLAGLLFAILLIPLNRWIAQKIGNYSTTMMREKDSRVKVL